MEDQGDWTLSFQNPCSQTDVVTIPAQSQSAPTFATDSYTGTESVFTYTPYAAVPALCELEVSCKETSPVNARFPCTEITNGVVSRTFTSDDYENGLEPGTYTTTYEVCVKDAPTVCETFTTTHTLVDPCDPPKSISLSAIPDVNYVLTLDAETVTVPTPTVDPSYCKVYFTDSIQKFPNGETGVTSSIPENGQSDTVPNYSVYWDKDLYPVSPVAQTEIVTITAVAGSLYSGS